MREAPRWAGTLVDCVVVLGTVALVLTMLDESFWSRGYLVAGLVPVVFLLALAWLVRSTEDGVWVYALVSLLAYAPLGALAALQRPGPWIVPTVETMNRVLGDTYTAPRLFVSTLPPVEAAGTLMLLPYAIGFGTAFPAAWLALGTRRAIAPMVPLVAGLAATITVAVLIPDYYVLRGAVLTVVLVTWVAARARRAEALVGRRRTGLAATLVAALVVGAVSGVVSVLVPDNDQTDRVRLDPAGDRAVASSASETLIPPGEGRQQLFRAVGVPDGARMRLGTLDLYDGESWRPADESPGAGPAGTFRRLGRVVEPLHPGPEVEVRVRIAPAYTGDWLPMLGELTGLELDYRDGRTQIEDVRYNQATSSAVVVGGVDPRDDYTFTSVVPSAGLRPSDATMTATEEQRQPEGAFLDRFLVPFDRPEVSPLQRVLLLARYLRLNGEVRLSGSSSQSPVDLGLRLVGADRMSATPFQYSAVTALGASRLGVPARVVLGATPGRRGIVTRSDIVSWVELQLADGTWRTLDPARYTGVHSGSDEEVTIGAPEFVEEELDLDDDQVKIPKGADIELSPDAVIEEQTNPWRYVGLAAAAIAGALLALLALVPLAKRVRRVRRRRTTSWSGLYVNGWQEVLDAARDRGTPVPEGWSRVAQAGGLGVDPGLARRADAAVFAPAAGPAEDGLDYWQACQALRRQVLAEADVRHRAWALVNPASLLAGWARGRRHLDGRSGRQVRHEDRRARRQQPTGA
ncbi:transglutaminase domain-containing protein [Nocardioides oleivorans]|uniref:Transglutaminase domain-containing protein n=1 Tax=Nocardioides oleivorans TaxID=273676 RepID=A0A4Q2RV92_9ACTN|nr:transglutaminaseTgpA domain-containing protein [Nocardioides oleivorans]RYB91914.1 transglutaminase domain-containing protein [Nocardioides oleivorans]